MKASALYKRVLQTLMLATVLVVTTSWAKLPPPPVNQNLGMPDIRYKLPMSFYTCLSCHDTPPNAVISDKEEGYLPYRHHLRVDTPIDEYSAAPFSDTSADGTYQCITCHESQWTDDPAKPQGGYFQFVTDPSSMEFRNCLNCHKQSVSSSGRLTATVHHLTGKAQKTLCYQCHGSVVNNATDDHRIPDPTTNKSRNCQKLNLEPVDPTAINPDNPTPTEANNYNISLITPWPGDNYDDLAWKDVLLDFYSECPDVANVYLEEGGRFEINPPRYRYEINSNGYFTAILVPDRYNGGRRTGNCEHCHFAGENPGNSVQPNTGSAHNYIATNMTNHHSTGIGQPGTGSVHTCNLCHTPQDPPDYAIRGCELCHAISTLHSIEYDAEGDGIIPGLEKPFMGHVGNDLNCRGCHLNFRSGIAQESGNTNSRAFDSQGGKISIFGSLPGYNSPVPDIESLSTTFGIEGKETDLTITGSGFFASVEIGMGLIKEAIPHVELIDSKGNVSEFILDRSDVTETVINVTIPATMPPDIYDLYVVKGKRYTELNGQRDYSQQTAVTPFLIKPSVKIDSVICNDGLITIDGTGFGNMVTTDRYGRSGYIESHDKTGVSADGENCIIDSWSSDKIIAKCNTNADNITINSIYGDISSTSSCSTTSEEGEGRPTWWAMWSWFISWGWAGR